MTSRVLVFQGFFLCNVLLVAVHPFAFNTCTASTQEWRKVGKHAASDTTKIRCHMVRNIDLPEAIVLYGSDVIWTRPGTLREGLLTLIRDSQTDGAAILYIGDDKESVQEVQRGLSKHTKRGAASVTVVKPSNMAPPAPNPHDLLVALETVTIQPRAFGGSSGFAKGQYADPPRHPLPTRTVVLSTTLDQTRAARAAGMRVIRILNVNEDDNYAVTKMDVERRDIFGSKQIDPLADMVIQDAIDFTVDDIATPGSFWLNPPHPRDDEGNRVDPYTLMTTTTTAADTAQGDKGPSAEPRQGSQGSFSETMSEDELRQILADLDPYM